MHRVASSTQYNSGLIEIQTLWSLGDIMRAHQTLDALEDAEYRSLKKAKQGGK